MKHSEMWNDFKELSEREKITQQKYSVLGDIRLYMTLDSKRRKYNPRVILFDWLLCARIYSDNKISININLKILTKISKLCK